VPDYPTRFPKEGCGYALLSIDSTSARSEPVEDLDAIACRGLQDRVGSILFKTIHRARAKYAATDAEVVTFESVEVGAGEVRFLSHRSF
jgi:hypothetical protein